MTMEFSRTEIELELEARTAAFIRDVIIPYERDARHDSHGPTDALRIEMQAKAREAGLLAPHLPKEYGGYGLNHRQQATVFRAAGYSILGPTAMNIMAPDEGNMHLLEKIATPEQKARYLEPLARADVRSAFYMTEPGEGAGSDPSMMQTTARQDGNHWVIDGRKWMITGGPGSAFGIVMAKTPNGATMFLVDTDKPGLSVERVPHTIDHSMVGGHAVMRLEGVRVSSDQVLGAVDEGFRYAQVRLAPARLTHCMRWWGAAKRAHDTACAYAARRSAFGKKLFEHEGVGFMLADNLADLQQALLMIDHTAWVLDQGGSGSLESSMAKLTVSEALYRVADRSLQVLGGLGATDDTPVQQIFRDIRAFRIYDGPSEVHRWSIARRLQRETERLGPQPILLPEF
jgi:acyl-CoA dehydrogenase